MKNFNRHCCTVTMISIVVLLGGCTTAEEHKTHSIVGGSVGGVAGLLPSDNQFKRSDGDANTQSSDAKTLDGKNVTGNTARK